MQLEISREGDGEKGLGNIMAVSVQLYSDLAGLAVGLVVFALLAVSWFFFAQKRPIRSDILVILVLLNIALAAGLFIIYLYRDIWLVSVKQS
jgi:uncharacterized membrane protein